MRKKNWFLLVFTCASVTKGDSALWSSILERPILLSAIDGLLYSAGVYILENTSPPLGGEISANVIWGKKYEKGKRKRGRETGGKCKRKRKKEERKRKKGERK
jgi:hypothetical protein